MYSPSRIGTFSDCRLKYKYEYIDKLESDLETIEAFRGGIIHQVLEEFYKLVKGGLVKNIDWVIKEYTELWSKNYNQRIKIVKKQFTAEDYFNKGKQCLLDYYEKYKPFNQAKVVATEEQLLFAIKYNETTCQFRGILDRLDWNDKTNMFEIHDYKVNNKLITQGEADNDWQLGLYSIALKNKWPDADKVKLIWHSLLFNKEVVSSRTPVQAEELQKNVIGLIKEIESCEDFYPEKSPLCDWCDFQKICPLWRHPKKMEDIPVNEYKNDDGVKLVEKYAALEGTKNELKKTIYEIEEEQAKIKEVVIEYAEKEKISVIDGSEAQIKIDIKNELKAPTKSEDPSNWVQLRDFLIKEGRYQDVSTVNSNMLSYKLRGKDWPADFIEKIKKFLKREVTKTIKLIKK